MTGFDVPAVSVALVRGDRILLVRRGRSPSLGLYAFPGGRVEPGETAEEAARRELMEETGLTAGTLSPYREYLIEPEEKPIGFRLQVFVGSYGGGDALAGDDAEDVGWFTLADMRTLPVIDSVLEVARELLAPQRS
jgi:8-oxo-dGTP diphosphatase